MLKYQMPSVFKGKKEKAMLALDLGSEAVKTLVFSKRGDNSEVLGYSLRYFEGAGLFGTGNFYQESAKKTIFEAIDEAGKKAGREIGEAWITISPDILSGEISLEKYNRMGGRKKISEKEEKEITQVILTECKENIAKKISLKTGILQSDIRFLGAKIMEIKIDGYEVPKMIGFGGSEIYAKILTVFAPKYYLEKISEILEEKKIKIAKIIHTLEILPGIFSKKAENGIFVDVGGEVSQVIFLKNGQAEGMEKMDFGGKNFSQAISRILGISLTDARLLKERYSRGELSSESSERIKKIISQDLAEFFRLLKEKITDLSVMSQKKTYLYGGGCILPPIEETIREGSEEKNFEPFPDVKIISPLKLKKDLKTPEINTPQFTQAFLLII